MDEGTPRRMAHLATCLLLVSCFGLLVLSCGESHEAPHDHAGEHDGADGHAHASGGESWSVTAWGKRYEVFPEIDALVAGEAADAHVHVTALDGFAPLAEGRVEIVLIDEDGEAETFDVEAPARPGVFNVELRPSSPGERDLAFRITSHATADEVAETIRGGRVRVGTKESPGGPLRLPAPRGPRREGQPLSFLKEEQWQAPFATTWVREGRLARSVEGFATVRPPAGAEAWITAPVDGMLRARPWPHPGQSLQAGKTIFRLVPGVGGDRSLPELRADLSAARDELAAAENRLQRLETLHEVEATSERELEEARTRVAVLRSRAEAAESDLASARSARAGGGDGEALPLTAPFAGRISRVDAGPGAAVKAGERLARLVGVDRAWLALDAEPSVAARLEAGVAGVVLGDSGPSFGADEARLVSVAPEVDAETGKLRVLIEIPGGVPLGSEWTARALLAESREGLVIPASSLVDDGGVPVVYLQLSGERFVRQVVDVVERQGDRVLVEGLAPGQRLVSRGGESIRRSSLLASGGGDHGHVH